MKDLILEQMRECLVSMGANPKNLVVKLGEDNMVYMFDPDNIWTVTNGELVKIVL